MNASTSPTLTRLTLSFFQARFCALLGALVSFVVRCLKHNVAKNAAVALDERGHRIGYGKGYYDKLLCGRSKDRTLLCALVLDVQLRPNSSLADVCEPHDVAVDVVITERHFIDLRIDDKSNSD